MKKQLDEVSPYLFGDHLILSLDKDWIKVFNGIPKFSVQIDNESITLHANFKKQRSKIQ